MRMDRRINHLVRRGRGRGRGGGRRTSRRRRHKSLRSLRFPLPPSLRTRSRLQPPNIRQPLLRLLLLRPLAFDESLLLVPVGGGTVAVLFGPFAESLAFVDRVACEHCFAFGVRRVEGLEGEDSGERG